MIDFVSDQSHPKTEREKFPKPAGFNERRPRLMTDRPLSIEEGGL
jgi:hypothetical protein